MAIKVIEYLVAGQSGNAAKTFYDAVSANVDAEWTVITVTTPGVNTAGESVTYAELYENVTEIATNAATGQVTRKASVGTPTLYGTAPEFPGPGTGNVQGPAGAVVDNTAVRWDGTDGFTTQGSPVVISDAGAVSGVTTISMTGAITGVTNLKSAVSARNPASIAQNLTRYIALDAGGGDAAQTADPTDPASTIEEYAWVAPFAGSITNLYGRVTTAPAAGQTFTITLMKNAVAQTLTAQFTDAGVTASDTSHSVSFVAGDRMAWRIVTSATSGAYLGSLSAQVSAIG